MQDIAKLVETLKGPLSAARPAAAGRELILDTLHRNVACRFVLKPVAIDLACDFRRFVAPAHEP